MNNSVSKNIVKKIEEFVLVIMVFAAILGLVLYWK